MNKEISAEFSFESKYIDIKGSKMHYIDVGEGDPILFLHGNPTSSYLWRNVIPHVQSLGRCIAPDLIGMGKSDKPDIDYTFDDHYAYILEFIEKMELKNVTLVIHDWGSGLGFHYANMHRDNIKGIAFMEAMVKPLLSSDLPADFAVGFKMMRMPVLGWLMISVGNMFLTKMLPDLIKRNLTKEETARYLEPYPTVASRKPVRVWPMEVPIDGKPKHTHDLIQNYSDWLKETDLPKLFLHVLPGAILKKEDIVWVEENLKNLTSVDLGEGLHFFQEDNPHMIGEEVAKWYQKL